MKNLLNLLLITTLVVSLTTSCRKEAFLNHTTNQKVYLKSYKIVEGGNANVFTPTYNSNNQVTAINNNGTIINCIWDNATTWTLTYPTGERMVYDIPSASSTVLEENRMPTAIKYYLSDGSLFKTINITRDGGFSAVKNSKSSIMGGGYYHLRNYNIIDVNTTELETSLTSSGDYFKRSYVITNKQNKIINSCRELYWFLLTIDKSDIDDYAMSPIWQGLFLPKSVVLKTKNPNDPNVWNSTSISNLSITYDAVATNYPKKITPSAGLILQHEFEWELR